MVDMTRILCYYVLLYGSRKSIYSLWMGQISRKKIRLKIYILPEPPMQQSKALFSYTQNLKTFQDFSSHQILWHMHVALNIDKK